MEKDACGVRSIYLKSRFKIYHNFLKHYSDGETVIDSKPITVTEIGPVKKYIITFQEHSDGYDFF